MEDADPGEVIGSTANDTSLVITNTGASGSQLNITDISATGPFTIYDPADPTGPPPSDNFSLASGNSRTVNVACNTSTPGGPFAGTLAVTYNLGAGNLTANYTLNCNVQDRVPVFNTSPVAPGNPANAINFGELALNGAVGQQTLTISNDGNDALSGTISLSGPNASRFTVQPTGSYNIPESGADVNLLLTCLTSQQGTFSATLSISSNDPLRPTNTYPLSCQVTAPAPAMAPPPPRGMPWPPLPPAWAPSPATPPP
ncbi:MAG: choice-of-anchor D domain-containing protein [Anaerolineae bacterium]|nr:choice-of-anchor D domain-containing protein [Anaerolineae bacterium]